MSKLVRFYDRYHLKNNRFAKVISSNNFTYFYILKLLQRACIRPVAQKKILDLGCGVGTMSLYLAAQGATVTGLDISERAVGIAQQAAQSLELKKVIFIRQDVLKKITGTFDVIITFEVIEHIVQQDLFLHQIKAYLKPQAKLILSTPSNENWLFKLGFYRGFDAEVGHVRRYSEHSLRMVLEKNGFTVVEIKSVEGPLRNVLFTTRLGFLIRFIKGPLVPLFHVFDMLSGKVFGFSDIQVIAQKT